MANVIQDLACGSKTTVRILNLKEYPVVVNDAGQAVFGMGEAKVDKNDATLLTSLKAGFVQVIR